MPPHLAVAISIAHPALTSSPPARPRPAIRRSVSVHVGAGVGVVSHGSSVVIRRRPGASPGTKTATHCRQSSSCPSSSSRLRLSSSSLSPPNTGPWGYRWRHCHRKAFATETSSSLPSPSSPRSSSVLICCRRRRRLSWSCSGARKPARHSPFMLNRVHLRLIFVDHHDHVITWINVDQRSGDTAVHRPWSVRC